MLEVTALLFGVMVGSSARSDCPSFWGDFGVMLGSSA